MLWWLCLDNGRSLDQHRSMIDTWSMTIGPALVIESTIAEVSSMFQRDRDRLTSKTKHVLHTYECSVID